VDEARQKAAPVKTQTHAEALEAALCYGWIDGQAARYDDHYTLMRFTPRRSRSKWSQINRERAEQLIAQGKMKPAGLAAVQAAKTDGRWDAAYPPQSTAPVRDDLRARLTKSRGRKRSSPRSQAQRTTRSSIACTTSPTPRSARTGSGST